jgi:membrane fusion protein, peptide pheromone/bacteriocin exporter
MILKDTELKNTAIWWLPAMRRSGFIVYWIVIGLFLSGFLSLFFIHVDISVRANGIIRPLNERTDIKSPVSGLIDTIYFKEGDQVVKNNILLVLHDPGLIEKQHLNEAEISRCKDFIHDLVLLNSSDRISAQLISLLMSPLYKEKTLRFISMTVEQQIILAKAKHETSLNEKLAKDKVISPKEFYDIRMQQQKVVSAYKTFQREQQVNWQADLDKYKTELKQCFSRQAELRQLYETDRIRAPVSGCLQDMNGHYTGNSIQAGELICAISPGGQLMGECYVLSKDIGMLKTGQPARFRIDAFNYNYFGVVNGTIYSIDNDFILMDKTPVFKVRCQLNERILKLPNGYTGELKKGMSFQARFITCNRSLWQLLFDGLDDLLNPAHQPILKTS